MRSVPKFTVKKCATFSLSHGYSAARTVEIETTGMIKAEEVYRIGRIGKPHGVQGEVSLQFDDDVFDRVEADYLILNVDEILVPFYMEAYRFRSQTIALVKFCDVDSQEKARRLTGCEVFFPRCLSDNEEGIGGWSEIVGYRLVDAGSANVVGNICSVDDTTANILFEVETPAGRIVLIPASEELITEVDKQQRLIQINLPQGILDLD